jgi:hypothetical protein
MRSPAFRDTISGVGVGMPMVPACCPKKIEMLFHPIVEFNKQTDTNHQEWRIISKLDT